jgi:tetratricopeptide (TPR) repeat protein
MRALSVLALLALVGACAPADPAVRAERQLQACANAMGLPQERLHACSEVIAAPGADPRTRAEALIERGVQRAALGQHIRAIADFGRALRADPSQVRAYIERGQVHYDRGAYERAVADYDAALALQPGLQEAVQRREAALRGRESEQVSQLDLFTQALASNPEDPTLWNNRCWIRAVSGEELDYALADCNEALRLDPRHAAALDSRGLVHIKRGEFNEAIADYEAALAVEPGRGHYLYGRGVARLGLGQKQQGEADLAAAERAEPGVGEMYRTYGVEI